MPAAKKNSWRSRHVYHGTENHTAAIGDEEGHLVTFFASRGMGFLEGGETYEIDTHGYMDAYETSGTGQGYAEFTFADGCYRGGEMGCREGRARRVERQHGVREGNG